MTSQDIYPLAQLLYALIPAPLRRWTGEPGDPDERDLQPLLSTPLGVPRHTVKKTYVVDTLYVDLIERYAQAEGVEMKAVINLALHEFFERRRYLPEEEV